MKFSATQGRPRAFERDEELFVGRSERGMGRLDMEPAIVKTTPLIKINIYISVVHA